MKDLKFIFIILFFTFANTTFSQVSGTIIMDSLPLFGAEIKFKESHKVTGTDFDGNFVLQLDSEIENKTLIISYVDLSIEIKNIELNNWKLNIGEFEIPYFKDISITEFEKLSASEKENCIPIYQYYQKLIGYYNTNKLNKAYLTLNCEENITEFDYNSTTKTVFIDWNQLKECK